MADSQRFYYKGNRIKQLRAFCATAQTQNMSRAAQYLHQSQPTVSQQIKALEDELGETLFQRNGPRISLTPAGKTFYELANPLVEGLEALPGSFAESMSQSQRGELHLAAGESTILYLLPPLLKAFREHYPDIHLHLHNVTGRDGMRMLREDEVDLAVGSMLEIPTDIDYRPLYHYDPALILPLEHPLANKESLTLNDLSPYGLILPPRRLSTWRLVDLVFHEHGVPYRVALEVGGWEVIKRYVELGMGISIVTSICLRENEPLATRDVSEWFPRRSYGLVLRKGKYLSPPAQLFLQTVEKQTQVRIPETTFHSER